MRVGSLFSGVGGMDLGLEQAGHEIVWQVEWDKDCQAVLRHRFPQTALKTDILLYTQGQHKNRVKHGLTLPPVDMVVGGFPCQDVSVAGQRKGLAGERSGLFFAFMRLLKILRPLPQIVMLENVPGLLSSHGGRDFHAVLAALAERGFRRGYRILDSQHFGVPQRRRRVFIVGCARASGIDPREILFESVGRDGHLATRPATRPRVAATLRGRSQRAGVNAPGRGGEDDDNLICFDWQSGGDVRHNYSSSSSSSLHVGQTPAVFQCHGSNVGEMGTLRKGNGNITGGVPFLAATLNAGGHDGGFRTEPGEHQVLSDAGERARALTGTMWKKHDDDTDTLIPTSVASPITASAGHHGHSSPRGDGSDNLVAAWDERNVTSGANRTKVEFGAPANTLHSGGLSIIQKEQESVAFALRRDPGGIGQAHNTTFPNGVRRLTPIECERLQGFPDGWTCRCGHGHLGSQHCTCPDTPRYKQMGNAVTVSVARWIGERLALIERKMRATA